VLKRFISEDPIGSAGGLNLYSYVLGQPTSFLDPSGLEVTMVCRPVDGYPYRKHCAVFVWHWEYDPCYRVWKKVVDGQYSLPGGDRSPTKDSNNGTYGRDRDSFSNPGGRNAHYEATKPNTMSQSDFDQRVRDVGDNYRQGLYSLSGPNSNTAARQIILGAGGQVPLVPGATAQDYRRGHEHDLK